jgi:hypothetical protein
VLQRTDIDRTALRQHFDLFSHLLFAICRRHRRSGNSRKVGMQLPHPAPAVLDGIKQIVLALEQPRLRSCEIFQRHAARLAVTKPVLACRQGAGRSAPGSRPRFTALVQPFQIVGEFRDKFFLGYSARIIQLEVETAIVRRIE